MGNICNKKINNYVYYPNKTKEVKGDFPFEYIVIEGGGIKMIPSSGAIRALGEYGILENLTKFAGSSAGAILSTALACEYTPDEIDQLMMDTDFNKFLDDDYGFLRDTYRMSKDYGLCPGEYFREWMDEHIAKKLRKKNATFKDLKELKDKYLYITSLCVDDNETKIFSYENSPDMPISLAVRMSMSIPILFCSVKYKGKRYVDGGVSDNYPITIFDTDKKNINKTLGLKLMSKDEKRNGRIYTGKLDTTNMLKFTGSILTHVLNEIERREIGDDYWERTISINTGDIGMVEFDIDRKKRVKYIKSCYSETKIALKKYKDEGSF